MNRDFAELIQRQWAMGKHLCVGLDVDVDKFPDHLNHLTPVEAIRQFCFEVVAATQAVTAAYKPNLAYFERYGAEGVAVLKSIISHIHQTAPDIAVIVDAKRADIANTNNGYVINLFEYLGSDATTLHPYLGAEALTPYLQQKGKGLFILCRTSNSGAGEFQDLVADDMPLYLHVAKNVASKWQSQATLGLVVGATYPDELLRVRSVADELPLLIPGIGSQGGDLAATVKSSQSQDGTQRIIISASRSITYASKALDYALDVERAATQLADEIKDLL